MDERQCVMEEEAHWVIQKFSLTWIGLDLVLAAIVAFGLNKSPIIDYYSRS
jgi:hypothetical protein